MTTEMIWQDIQTRRTVTRSNVPSEPTLELLRSTVWGSRSMKYRIPNIDEKLARLRDPSFFVLSEKGRELCVFVLDRCSKQLSGTTCGAFHFALASTVTDRQNEGLAGVLIEHVRRYCISNVGKPGLGFAYVEATTEFSLRLSDQIGHTATADIPLTLFTRLFPRRCPNANRMTHSECDVVLQELEKMYVGHELTDFASSLKPEEFYILRENGTIVAGVQVELLQWSMMSMPGALGTFLVSVLPHLPVLRNILDLKNLRLARFSNLFFSDGHEIQACKFLEGCLSQQKSKVGLILLDRRSPVRHCLVKTGKLGIMSHAVNGSAKMRIDTIGMEDEMMSDLREKPLLVSAGDVF
jgi:hypothetical protein